MLLGVVARERRANGERLHRHWTGLALVCRFLALDEAEAVHEQLIDPVRDALGTGTRRPRARSASVRPQPPCAGDTGAIDCVILISIGEFT